MNLTKKNLVAIGLLMTIIAGCGNSFFNETESAQVFFGKIKDLKQFSQLAAESLPNEDDCKEVFKSEDDSRKYYAFVTSIRNKAIEQANKQPNDKIDKVVILTKDFVSIEGNDDTSAKARELRKIVEKFRKPFVFYGIEIAKSEDSVYSDEIWTWLKVNGKWVFFPNLKERIFE